jgi:hypothetical protein
MKQKNINSKISWIVLCVVTTVALFFWLKAYQEINVEADSSALTVVKNVEQGIKPTPENKANTVNYIINLGEQKLVWSKDISSVKTTALELLSEMTTEKKVVLETKDYAGLGKMIIKIGDLTNGQDNKYWQYWVNGKTASVGADSYQVEANDIIEWKFEPSSF